MNRGTGTYLAIIACAVLAVVVFFLADFGGGRSFATPEEAFEASCNSLKKNDLRGWCECLTADSRDSWAVKGVLFFVRKALTETKDEEDKAYIHAIAAVQAKHGLTDEFLEKYQKESMAMRRAPAEEKLRFAKAVLAPVADVNGFVADMHQVNVKFGADLLAGWADAKLTGVKTSGKRAVGMITGAHGGKEASRPMHFVNQNNSWRIDLLADDEPEPGPGFNPHGF